MPIPDSSAITIPVSPVLCSGVFRRPWRKVSSIRNLVYHVYVSSGTAAIYHALRCENIGHGDEVLLPAYICESVLEAILETGAKPVFYKIKRDTTADLNNIKDLVTAKSRAIIIAHLFGLRQRIVEFRLLCDSAALTLIEDCSHTFFCDKDEELVGCSADYAIASLPKFFPVYEGGILASSRHAFDQKKIVRRKLIYEIKGIYNAFEVAAKFRRFSVPAFLVAIPLMVKMIMAKFRNKSTRAPVSDQDQDTKKNSGYLYFNKSRARLKASLASMAISSLTDCQWLIEKRRRNYEYLRKNLQNLPATEVLQVDCGAVFVPYVYPLIINDRSKIIRLRQAGLPFWMWENIHNNVCEVSDRYSKTLIQIPCHQSLGGNDLDTIISITKRILSE